MGHKRNLAGGITVSTSSSQSTSASSQLGRQVDAKQGDAVEIEPADRQWFEALAEWWERDTVLLSSSSRATRHPAYQEFLQMGWPAVPLILQRMQTGSGHWLHALHDITGADPVDPSDYGKIDAMQASWLEWGERNGYV